MLTYYKQADGKINESMELATRIKPRDIQTVNVILDFKDQVVIKSIVNGEATTKDWNSVVSYFYPIYTATIERLFQENGHAISIKTEVPEKSAT